MNDPFTERLRALKPGALPDSLRRQLADPPDLPAADPAPPQTAPRRIFRVLFAASAAAACAVIYFGRNPVSPGPAVSMPAFAGTESSRVTEVRPLSVVTDASNRTWKLMEVNWVEENTLVAAARPVAVQFQDHYRTVVPVAVQFD